jgi:hypothetical protein
LGNIPTIANNNFTALHDTAYYVTGSSNTERLTSLLFENKVGLSSAQMTDMLYQPLITSVTGANQSATINFTQIPADSTITNYAYSTNGTDFILLSPSQTASPLRINGLTNGQTYNFTIRAFNGLYSVSSNSVSVTINFQQPAPIITSVTASNQTATIYFTQSENDGSAITNYAYSMNGIDFILLSPSQTASPLRINGLTNGQTYNVTIKAFNGLYSVVSNSVSVTLNSPPLAPTIANVTTSNQLATVIFTQPTNTGSGSLPITSYDYSTDNGVTYTSINQVTSPLLIPLVSSRNATYLIKIRGNNGMSGQVSNLFTFRKFTSIGKNI